MKLIPILIAALLAAPCFAQTNSPAQVFSGKDVSAQMPVLIRQAKVQGSSGAKLADYGSHAIQLSVRAMSGGAELHSHFDDVFYVTQGHATLVTGGSILNPKSHADGEVAGTGIENGQSRVITKGDIVNIPAGTPHQVKVAPGDVYAAVVIKVRESK
ncbi:MAG: cupin domain-containing protein [Acidobacteriaceae bacterium]